MTRDPNTNVITAVSPSTTPVRTTSTTYDATGQYWAHGTQPNLRMPNTVTVGPVSSTAGDAKTTYGYDTSGNLTIWVR